MNRLFSGQIDDIERVVADFGYEQMVAAEIDRKMVNPARNNVAST